MITWPRPGRVCASGLLVAVNSCLTAGAISVNLQVLADVQCCGCHPAGAMHHIMYGYISWQYRPM